MIINGINFDDVTKNAIKAAKLVATDGWDELLDVVENIGKSLVSDVDFVSKKKDNNEFEEADAKVFMEDQKTIARMRLRSIAVVTLKIAENIWNAIANVFNIAFKTMFGWVLL